MTDVSGIYVDQQNRQPSIHSRLVPSPDLPLNRLRWKLLLSSAGMPYVNDMKNANLSGSGGPVTPVKHHQQQAGGDRGSGDPQQQQQQQQQAGPHGQQPFVLRGV